MASTITIPGRGKYPLPDNFTYGEGRAVEVATGKSPGKIIESDNYGETAFAFALVALIRADPSRDATEHANYLDGLPGGISLRVEKAPEDEQGPLAETDDEDGTDAAA